MASYQFKKLPPVIKDRVNRLKNLENTFNEKEKVYQSELYKLEKEYNLKNEIIYKKRTSIINDIKNFWFTSLNNNSTIAKMIKVYDDYILDHLKDITIEHFDQSETSESPGFCIKFYFENNRYFSNKFLSKTYFISPNELEESRISESKGCEIHWKDKFNKYHIDKTMHKSFFDCFDIRTIAYRLPKAKLDFQIGHIIPTKFIPNAISYFYKDDFDFDINND